MADDLADDPTTPTCECKVGRTARRYGLAVDEPLRRRWTGADGEREGLRSLASWFDRQVLAAAMAAADMDPLDGEVENVYRLLTEEDVGAGDRTRARMRLQRAGVDVESVTDDFVSHQTIHGHLRECLDVESPSTDPGDRRERAAETVYRMQSRTEAVVGSAVESLEDAGDLEVGDARVFVDVQVHCTECGTRQSAGDLIEAGGCDCADAE